jgi:diguanylate cyclase
VDKNAQGEAATGSSADLFRNESEALERAKAISAAPDAQAEAYRDALGELIRHYERLMRETRRLIGRSDRAEREMQSLTQLL